MHDPWTQMIVWERSGVVWGLGGRGAKKGKLGDICNTDNKKNFEKDFKKDIFICNLIFYFYHYILDIFHVVKYYLMFRTLNLSVIIGVKLYTIRYNA